MLKYFLFFIFLCCIVSGTVAQTYPFDTFSVSAFGDYFYNIRRQPGIDSIPFVAMKGREGSSGFQIRRFFFTFDQTLSSSFSTRFRLESGIEGDSTRFFVKDAYVRWRNVFPRHDLIFGLQPTPAWDMAEQLWGYRPIEKTMMDLRRTTNSRDLGISLRGTIDTVTALSYCLMLGNGSNVGPETDNYKRFYVQLALKPFPKLYCVWFGEYREQRPISNVFSPSSKVSNDMLTTDIMIMGGKLDSLSLGAEGTLQMTYHGIIDSSKRQMTTKVLVGFSVFGSYALGKNLVLVGRVDRYNPNTQSSGDGRMLYLLGLNWKVDPTVSLLPNVIVESFEPYQGISLRSSITARLTVYYHTF